MTAPPEPATVHEHSWATDSFHAGFGCLTCSASYWDESRIELAEAHAEIKRLRKRTHEIQEAADTKYAELVKKLRVLEYWTNLIAKADEHLKEPGIAYHSAVTRSAFAAKLDEIEKLQAVLNKISGILERQSSSPILALLLRDTLGNVSARLHEPSR